MEGSTTGDIIGTMVNKASGKQRLRNRKGFNKKKAANMRDSAIYQHVRKMISEAANDNRQWQDFIERLSDGVLKSDKKLAKLLDTLHNNQKAMIEKAVNVLKNKFKIAGVEYKIEDKMNDDGKGNVYAELHFIPKGKNKGSKGYNFKGITVAFDESNKPAIYLDDDAKQFFNSHMNEELASQIRGSLLMIQDKHLVKLDKVEKAMQQLNAHMDSIESRIQKTMKDLPDLDLHMMKMLMKNKYNSSIKQ